MAIGSWRSRMLRWALFFVLWPSRIVAYDFYLPNSYDPLARNPIWEQRATPIHLDLDHPLTPPPPGGPWNPTAENLLRQWDSIIGTQFQFSMDTTPHDPCDYTTPNQNDITWRDLSEGQEVCGLIMPPGFLAITFIAVDPTTGFIQSADILLNAARTWTTTEQVQVVEPVMIQTVLGHELGHLLGLGHEDDVLAVMNTVYHPSLTLHADDRAGMRALYAASGDDTDFSVTPRIRAMRYPQVAATLLAPPSSISVESTFRSRWTIQAMGNRPERGSLKATLVLSPDLTIGPEDRVIFSYTISDIQAGGGSYPVLIQATVPADLATGLYYVGLWIDPDQVRSDTHRDNNTAVLPLPMEVINHNSPDLMADFGSFAFPFDLPATLTPGGRYAMEASTLNVGSSPAGASTTALQLRDFFFFSRRVSLSGYLNIQTPVTGIRSVPGLDCAGCGGSSSDVGRIEAQVPADILGGAYEHLLCGYDHAR